MRSGARGLPITLDVEGAKVLVIGGGDEMARRLELLREAGAELLERAAFVPRELDGAQMVFFGLSDPLLAAEVHAAARARSILCWCADDPAHSDFALPAVARLGRARLAISTSGASPALASRLRALFERELGDRFPKFLDALAHLRDELKRDEPAPAKRRARLLQAVDGFTLDVKANYPEWFTS
ncbi:MAG TPA: NAD(P)-dependent oxidoreductase [Polyangia bacterium]